MADFDEDDEEDNVINEDMNKFNELGLMRDSEDGYNNNNINMNSSDKGKPSNRSVFNNSLNLHNKIRENLANDSQEEIDENNDAEPEELVGRNQGDLNNTLDDIWTYIFLGKETPMKNIFPYQKMPNFSIGFYILYNMGL